MSNQQQWEQNSYIKITPQKPKKGIALRNDSQIKFTHNTKFTWHNTRTLQKGKKKNDHENLFRQCSHTNRDIKFFQRERHERTDRQN